MWQDGLSWREGFFKEISLYLWSEIKTRSDFDPIIAVYEKRKLLGGSDWKDLTLRTVLVPGSNSIRGAENFAVGGYYCVAIDQRWRSLSLDCEGLSEDGLIGKTTITAEYQVKDIGEILKTEDPLNSLFGQIRSSFATYMSDYSHKELKNNQVLSYLNQINFSAFGFTVRNLQLTPIRWPDEIIKIINDQTVGALTNVSQAAKLKAVQDKLANMGITNSALVVSVLAGHDTDFKAITGLMDTLANNQLSEREQNLRLLQWLKEQDLLTRVDAEPLISKVTESLSQNQPVLALASNSSPTPVPKQITTSPTNTDTTHSDTQAAPPPPTQENQASPETSSAENTSNLIVSRKKIKFSPD